jgi:hypothetical protein
MVYDVGRGRGRRLRSGGRRALGQAGEARCGARTAGARALRPRWQGGGASGRWRCPNRVGLRPVSSCPTCAVGCAAGSQAPSNLALV